jgi:hypothetical protein
MNLDRVHILNIVLMFAATIVAFRIPFELFLVAYAVLGPLHYLTQISWLHSRGYFVSGGRRDAMLLFALCGALLLLRYAVTPEHGIPVMPWASTVVLVGLALSVPMAFSASLPMRVVVLVATLLVAPVIVGGSLAQILLLTMLPTLVHVYLFTALFMLHGAVKNRSKTAVAQLAAFALCTASFFLVGTTTPGSEPGDYVRETYDVFASVNVYLAGWLGIDAIDPETIYTDPGGVALMRFIAFAYTYHYLNWFSKTSVIQWHKVPVAWSVANVVLWLGALALYAWDYRTGILVLFSLSWLHVFLELPLDFKTAAGIGRELRTLRPAVAP